ncbi:hypothetical protein IGM_01978 [Bacillus cereus HuB4-4]|uniref:Anti-sigma-W factor RsiW n=1 Tax=Bacillus cereus HuB4-4 TaxID=1053211 RepID=A0A9W5QWJ9_BACCE|nr:zf-HC2 domain-containing protein [Bacillus cereus]EOP91564.1 hypothetical protein IGM_01978 [Bacillus cereus HuB4-4]
MSCFNIGLIQAYINGELPHETRKKLISHLDTCEACQKSVLEISKLNQWVNLVLSKEPTHSLQEMKIDVDQVWERFKRSSQKNI